MYVGKKSQFITRHFNPSESTYFLHTQKSTSDLVQSTGIRLYLPFSDGFGTKRYSAWCHSNRKRVNII